MMGTLIKLVVIVNLDKMLKFVLIGEYNLGIRLYKYAEWKFLAYLKIQIWAEMWKNADYRTLDNNRCPSLTMYIVRLVLQMTPQE